MVSVCDLIHMMYSNSLLLVGICWQLDVIGIDEAQFFEDLYDFCCMAADHDGKTIIVAGLDGDYLRCLSNTFQINFLIFLGVFLPGSYACVISCFSWFLFLSLMNL